jgi:hypothetical protein
LILTAHAPNGCVTIEDFPRMRQLFTLVAGLSLLAAVAACSGKKDAADVNSAVAPAGFVPPTALNRTDFIDMVTRRFQELDVNHDSRISKDELPTRHRDVIASFDTDGDGMIGKEEFIKGSLARFDRADRNKDEVLTGDERRGAGVGADAGNSQDMPENTSAPIGS